MATESSIMDSNSFKEEYASMLSPKTREMISKDVYKRQDYQNTLNRFPNEAFIKKFVLKFLDDNSYANLKEAIAAGNVEEAFRAAHTLKGVCLSLIHIWCWLDAYSYI